MLVAKKQFKLIPISFTKSSQHRFFRNSFVPHNVLNKLRKRNKAQKQFKVQSSLEGHDLDLFSSNVVKQLLVIQDAAVQQASNDSRGLLYPLTSALEKILKFLQSGLDYLHVPYSYGWSIILLTIVVKIATFPLTRKQVESAMSMQAVKPRVDAIKRRFKDDKDRIQQETARLYAKANINPLAGCFPSLATIPIFLGLYRSLTNVASEGLLDKEGFYWLPTLAGPTSVAARQAGSGTSWLFPFIDNHPPIGWDEASRYLILPVLLVAIQYASTSIISPPVDPNDENANTQKLLVSFLPLFIGWFALNLPSGLSLYYFSNITLTSAQQIYFRKLGGIQIQTVDLGPINKPGSGRRRGKQLSAVEMEQNLLAGYLEEIEKEKEELRLQRLADSPLGGKEKMEGGKEKIEGGNIKMEGGKGKIEGDSQEKYEKLEGEGSEKLEQEIVEKEVIQSSDNGVVQTDVSDHKQIDKPIDRRCKRKKQVVAA